MGSKINGDENDYEFSIAVFNETPNNSKIHIYPPAEIPMPIGFQCSAISGISSISCIEGSGYVEVNTTFATSSIP